jgi:phosphate-selective porin OprO/OprP
MDVATGKGSWRIWLLAAALAAAPTGVWAQDGRGTGPGQALSERMSADRTSSGAQPSALGQLASAETGPEGGSPPPPPSETSYDDLARRVAELEQRLARSAEMEAAAKRQAAAKPAVAPSGRIQFDVANFSQNDASDAQYGDVQNAVGFRRARIALLGQAFDVVDYIIEMDFANRGMASVLNSKDQATGFKDVYIQVRELPLLGNVRVGHFKECFGLEQLTSDNYSTFMERSIDDEGTFVPGRNNGIMAFNWTGNERATWAIGAFTNNTGYDQPPLFQYDHWGLDMAMRGTYLPWYDEPSVGRGLWHTGLGYVYRSAPDHIQPFAMKPEAAFFTPGIIALSLPNVDNTQVVGAETAFVYGPLSLQSEFFAMTVNRTTGASNNFYGCYAFVSYFLTGENRPYNRKLGVFDRVRPFENFFRVRTGDGDVVTGLGAWEVAYRFSYVDMLDGLTPSTSTKGAALAVDHTIGLSWYLNPYAKVMFNYVHSLDTANVVKGGVASRVAGGTIDVFEMRFHMDF